MTTEQETVGITLEAVRTRFLEAETALADANRAITAIQGASVMIGEAKESVTVSAGQLGALAAALSDMTGVLGDNATALREGVDAIRLGDPAEVRRMLSELDEAFTAFQATTGDRLEALAKQQKDLGVGLAGLAEAETSGRRRQMLEVRVCIAVVAIAGIVTLLASVLR
jgi:hypothetical protein